MAILGAACLLVLSCGEGEPGSGAAAPGPNLLLISLDTTRVDRLGCYGWEPAQTPTMDAIADAGVRFDHAYTHVPFTTPSHATILTGVHPAGHGLHVNYSGIVSDQVTNLAQILKQEGVRTGAFIAARVLNEEFGLSRGFDRYDDLPPDADTELERVQRPGDAVVDDALRWLEREPSRRFFAWVHLFDAHEPRQAPPGYEGIGSDIYDCEIAFMDAQVQRLTDWLDAEGLREDTLIVIVSDHGEGLGDHGEPDHGLFVYDSVMRVPFIMTHPAGMEGGRVVKDLVGMVDVHPTILGYLGLPIPRITEGRDFGPALRGESMPTQPLYFESEYALRTMNWAPLRGLISPPWKYIHAPVPELYNIEEDPGESNNLAAQRPEVVDSLRHALERYRANALEHEAGAMDESSEVDLDLRTLGYLGGNETIPAEAEQMALRNPVDHLETFLDLKEAERLRGEGQGSEAMQLARSVAERTPETPGVWSLLAEIHTDLKMWSAAESAYQAALDLEPEVAWRHRAKGDAQREQGRIEDAIASYQRALELDPSHGQAHSRMGFIYARRGDSAKAIAAFEQFAALEPDSANAHTNLANAYMQGRQFDKGLQSFRQALQVDAQCAPAHAGLGRALQVMGRRREAIEARRSAIRSLPGAPEHVAALAWLLATSQDPSLRQPGEALTLAQQAVTADPGRAEYADVLAACHAANGDFGEAVSESQRALELAARAPQSANVAAMQTRLELYRSGRPYVE